MTTEVFADNAERFVRELAGQLVHPAARECLGCYVQRMVTAYGCDNTLRWVEKWQRAMPQSTRRLRTRLRSRGAFCDCEVILNVFDLDIPRRAQELSPCAHEQPEGQSS